LLDPEPLEVEGSAAPCLLRQSSRSVPDKLEHWEGEDAPPIELASLALPGVEVSLLEGLEPDELSLDELPPLEPEALLPELEAPALELSLPPAAPPDVPPALAPLLAPPLLAPPPAPPAPCAHDAPARPTMAAVIAAVISLTFIARFPLGLGGTAERLTQERCLPGCSASEKYRLLS